MIAFTLVDIEDCTAESFHQCSCMTTATSQFAADSIEEHNLRLYLLMSSIQISLTASVSALIATLILGLSIHGFGSNQVFVVTADLHQSAGNNTCTASSQSNRNLVWMLLLHENTDSQDVEMVPPDVEAVGSGAYGSSSNKYEAEDRFAEAVVKDE